MSEQSEAVERDIGQMMKDHVPIRDAIERARVETVLRHRRTGVPMAMWCDGHVCLVSADEIRLPGEEGTGR